MPLKKQIQTTHKKCKYCHTKSTPNKKRCSQCGFPINGTTAQKITFDQQHKSKKRDLAFFTYIKIAVILFYGLFGILGANNWMEPEPWVSDTIIMILSYAFGISCFFVFKLQFISSLLTFVFFLSHQIIGSITIGLEFTFDLFMIKMMFLTPLVICLFSVKAVKKNKAYMNKINKKHRKGIGKEIFSSLGTYVTEE